MLIIEVKKLVRIKATISLTIWFNYVKFLFPDFKILFFFIYFIVTPPKKDITKKLHSKKIVCEVSIIMLISQKLGSVGPVQQQIKLPSPKLKHSIFLWEWLF